MSPPFPIRKRETAKFKSAPSPHFSQLKNENGSPNIDPLRELSDLCLWKWQNIALEMNCSPKHVFKVHMAALAA